MPPVEKPRGRPFRICRVVKQKCWEPSSTSAPSRFQIQFIETCKENLAGSQLHSRTILSAIPTILFARTRRPPPRGKELSPALQLGVRGSFGGSAGGTTQTLSV